MSPRRAGRADALTAFNDPIESPDVRRSAGRARRSAVPRSSHATWTPPPDRADPVEVLVESSRGRVADLVPIRFGRMAASPFAFLRGSALVMAIDLAGTPRTGLDVRLCGDAHVGNFGVFASPERRLVFDLNDFDETADGPFEWDVKRLAASLEVAGRELGLHADDRRDLVRGAVSTYAEWIATYAEMTHLDVWYAHLDVQELLAVLDGAALRRTREEVRRARSKDHLRALAKLTTEVDGRRRIVEQPPLLHHVGGPEVRHRLEAVLAGYRQSLPTDRRALFDRYRFVDFARKVVGVGSVGTRCWIALFQGPNGGPLFLQVKEANAAAPEVALGGRPSARRHHGERVVDGQRMLQATSDVLLGWATDPELGTHYYVRQLWDAKRSADIAAMRPSSFALYARVCARALARAHARTADSVALSGYLGTGSAFPDAIATFASAYADQTERDHAALVAAIGRGAVPAVN